MSVFVELILGGARSGKSRLAEQRALASGKQLFYIATAMVGDDEMAQRVQMHQDNRSSTFTVVETPISLAETLRERQAEQHCLVVDCLTLWQSNCMAEEVWQRERQALLEALPTLSGHVILISNETGMGVVPMGELTRRFVDEAGWLHQSLAALSEQVTLTVAGLPLQLKPTAAIQ